jgi:hypothetical protein
MAVSPSGEPGVPEPASRRPTYLIRNPWRKWPTAAFAGGSSMLTVTTLFYALGRLPLGLVVVSVVLAGLVSGFGFYARRRADQYDAQQLTTRR